MAIIGLAQDGYYAVKIASSNALSLAGDYVLLDWEQEGLLKPPIARTSQVFLIQDADFGAREEALGVLSARDSEAINGLLPRKRSSF